MNRESRGGRLDNLNVLAIHDVDQSAGNGKILAEPTCKLTLTEPPATGIGKPGLCSWQDAAGTSGASPNRSSNRSDLSEEKNCFGSLTNF